MWEMKITIIHEALIERLSPLDGYGRVAFGVSGDVGEKRMCFHVIILCCCDIMEWKDMSCIKYDWNSQGHV